MIFFQCRLQANGIYEKTCGLGLIMVLLALLGCNADTSSDQESTTGQLVEVKTFNNNSGWGYDIYVDGEKFIHQPHIPAIRGNKSFQSKRQAEKVADLVTDKIRNNITPPKVTLSELEELGINFK